MQQSVCRLIDTLSGTKIQIRRQCAGCIDYIHGTLRVIQRLARTEIEQPRATRRLGEHPRG